MKTKKVILKLVNIFFSVLIICSIFACDDTDTYEQNKRNQKYEIQIIDSCEYIVYRNGYDLVTGISHKGNCKNPKHKQLIHDTVYLIKNK